MIVYNVTTKVEWAVAEQWVQWMKNEHIPGILATGHFSGHRFYKLLQVDDVDGQTYTVQFFANTLMDYEAYIQQHSAGFRKAVMDVFGDRLIAFRSVMEAIE